KRPRSPGNAPNCVSRPPNGPPRRATTKDQRPPIRSYKFIDSRRRRAARQVPRPPGTAAIHGRPHGRATGDGPPEPPVSIHRPMVAPLGNTRPPPTTGHRGDPGDEPTFRRAVSVVPIPGSPVAGLFIPGLAPPWHTF